MNKLLILSGSNRTAAEIFREMYQKITGISLEILGDRADCTDADLVVIGSDAVNFFSHQLVMEHVLDKFELRTGSDDYRMKSLRRGEQRILLLAGACGRADIYAVYHYFERYANCRYFWDGDRIPWGDTPPLEGVDYRHRFRFRYRGMRYFAHRSLHRFQAEHWNFEDWKKELDWLLKRRFNLFMLRLGQDDLFQRAFDHVAYPPEDGFDPDCPRRSYSDRTGLWPLKFHGELQKKVHDYAASHGLVFPEDMGPMTHWYTPTPQDFLDRYTPRLLTQSGGFMSGERNVCVWDFSHDRELDYYWRLTEKHIERYGGAPDMFHIIGLAERTYGTRDENFQMKLYTYRRFIRKLREKYPNAPLLIASWDFLSTWRADEVRAFLTELDPANTIILDYTTDADYRTNDFRNWGLPHNFPWIFGIFQALERDPDLTFDFARAEGAFDLTRGDERCLGMVLWSENSHANPLLLEYLAKRSAGEEFSLETFCRDRYRTAFADRMKHLWELTAPAFAEAAFVHDPERPHRYLFRNHYRFMEHMKVFADKWPDEELKLECRRKVTQFVVPGEFFALAAALLPEVSEAARRDLLDLVRTVFGGVIARENAGILLNIGTRRLGMPDETPASAERLTAGLGLLAEWLEQSDEFSLNATLREMAQTHPVNPQSEAVLKGNAENFYCRGQIYELYPGIFLPEAVALRDWLARPEAKLEELQRAVAQADDAFYARPLAELAPDPAHRTPERALSILRRMETYHNW